MSTILWRTRVAYTTDVPGASSVHRSPLALTVLSLLVEGPLHPYAMQTRIKAWGKDQVVNVGQRANLYKTIERLRDAGLVAVDKTERDQRFPERTVYRLTDEGWRQAGEWLREMLATPRQEFPEFPAALSFVFGLEPPVVLAALEARAAGLREKVEAFDRELESADRPPRLFLLETEYMRTVAAAELEWVEGVVQDLRDGRLKWDLPQFEGEYAELARQSLSDRPPGGP